LNQGKAEHPRTSVSFDSAILNRKLACVVGY